MTKHLMTGPAGNSEFCFSFTSIFHSVWASGNFEGLGETKLAVFLGVSH